jgi:hypothetical protein
MFEKDKRLSARPLGGINKTYYEYYPFIPSKDTRLFHLDRQTDRQTHALQSIKRWLKF